MDRRTSAFINNILHVVIGTFEISAGEIVPETGDDVYEESERHARRQHVHRQHAASSSRHTNQTTELTHKLKKTLESVQLRKHCTSKAERHRARRSGFFSGLFCLKILFSDVLRSAFAKCAWQPPCGASAHHARCAW